MMTTDKQVQDVLEQILVWIRASSFREVGDMLAKALPTDKERLAYQTLDGVKTNETVKKDVQIGSERMTALVSRCVSMGLMERADGPAKRLFDLADFDLLPALVTAGVAKDGES